MATQGGGEDLLLLDATCQLLPQLPAQLLCSRASILNSDLALFSAVFVNPDPHQTCTVAADLGEACPQLHPVQGRQPSGGTHDGATLWLLPAFYITKATLRMLLDSCSVDGATSGGGLWHVMQWLLLQHKELVGLRVAGAVGLRSHAGCSFAAAFSQHLKRTAAEDALVLARRAAGRSAPFRWGQFPHSSVTSSVVRL